jgi:peptide/nickel transport system substrate-binding protein
MSNIRSNLGANVQALSTPILTSQINIDMAMPSKFNQAAAQQKLVEAGYRLQDKTVLDESGRQARLKLVTVKNPEYEKAASALTVELEQLGFKVDKEVFDSTNTSKDFLQEVLQPREYDILIYEISLGGDPDVFAYWHSSQRERDGFNLSNYSNAVVDDILSSARTTSDQALRRAKYKSFVERWQKDVPALGIYQVQMQYYYNKNVQPFNEDARLVAPLDRFSDVLYWASSQAEVYRTP